MVNLRWIGILIAILLIIPGTSGFLVDQVNVTSVSSMGATLSANTTAPTPYTYYFDIGTSSGRYQTRTKTVYTNATPFSTEVKGLPLFPDITYYFRPVVVSGGIVGYGAEDSFITTTRIPVENTEEVQEYASGVWTMIDFEYDPLTSTTFLTEFWINEFGQLFFGIIFAIVFLALWIRMSDVTIPLLVGVITGTTMIGLMPPEWQQLGVALFSISLAGYLYILFKKRRIET